MFSDKSALKAETITYTHLHTHTQLHIWITYTHLHTHTHIWKFKNTGGMRQELLPWVYV